MNNSQNTIQTDLKKSESNNEEVADMTSSYDLVVFSHLRWNFVYQRPQHLISRMAKHYKTLFIEEPIGYEDSEVNSFEMETITSQLTVIRPKVKHIDDIASVISQLHIKDVQIAWFYSAAFELLLDKIEPQVIIYDCMDELSLFKGADEQLKSQELRLIKKADLVFTGGKSLYEAKAQLSDNAYCFPSSVDINHFQKALKNLPVPDDMKDINKPVVGYIGVIDERIDIELLESTARKNSNYDFVMIGPVVKISYDDLPQLENIHYLGMKSYEELPGYLSTFEVAMMPFALNDSTKFISPTKTLEYMAAGKPIISTSIYDVVRDYSDVVYIVETYKDFGDALNEIKLQNTDYTNTYKSILDSSSWDHTASQMTELIKEVVA